MPRFVRHLFSAMLLPLLAAWPVAAQSTPSDSGFRFRVRGDVEVAAGEREGAVVVVRGTARILGTVGAVIVIDGTAILDGGQVKDLTVVRGTARLTNGAVVLGDVHLLDSKLDLEGGARVQGQVEQGVGTRLARDLLAIVALLSLGIMAALICAGVMAALVAPVQLVAAGRLIRAEPGRVVGSAAIVWLLLPIVAVLLIPSIIALPFGLGYFLFVLPVLGFLGMMVSGTWLGEVIIRGMRRDGAAVSPVAAAALGVACLVIVARIPLLGLASTVLVMLGAGAVLLLASRAVRRGRAAPVAASEPARHHLA